MSNLTFLERCINTIFAMQIFLTLFEDSYFSSLFFFSYLVWRLANFEIYCDLWSWKTIKTIKFDIFGKFYDIRCKIFHKPLLDLNFSSYSRLVCIKNYHFWVILLRFTEPKNHKNGQNSQNRPTYIFAKTEFKTPSFSIHVSRVILYMISK